MHWPLQILGLLAIGNQDDGVHARLVENPVDRRRQRGTMIALIVMTSLAVIFVVVRTISRFWVIRNPGMDDCLLILATLVLCGFLGGMGAAIFGNNMGYPTLSLSLDNIITLSKFALVVEVLYYFNICFIKVSIVLTYLRFGRLTHLDISPSRPSH